MTTHILYIDRFWISPYSFSSYVALKEKKLKFEVVEMALDKGENRVGAYKKNSLTARIPALQVNDFWIAESSAIAEFLDDQFSQYPLLPRDNYKRAHARMVMAWLRSDLSFLRSERSTATMFYERAKEPLSHNAEKEVQHLIEATDSLLSKNGNGTLFGEWSLADSELAFMLHRLILNNYQLPDLILEFAQSNWERPSVKEFVLRPRADFVLF